MLLALVVLMRRPSMREVSFSIPDQTHPNVFIVSVFRKPSHAHHARMSPLHGTPFFGHLASLPFLLNLF